MIVSDHIIKSPYVAAGWHEDGLVDIVPGGEGENAEPVFDPLSQIAAQDTEAFAAAMDCLPVAVGTVVHGAEGGDEKKGFAESGETFFDFPDLFVAHIGTGIQIGCAVPAGFF